MRFREVYQSLNEARPRPWRGDMRTRLRDKAMPDAEMAAASAKSAREASAAAWYEAIENETIFEDEVLLDKLESYEEVVRQGVVSGKNPYHFSWRVSKDGPYKITIRIKDVLDYAKPSEDTAALWKKIKTELKSMLASNGVLAHGVKVVEGGYVVCAWSLHNFEPFKNEQRFTRDDVIDDIKMGIESIVMVCDKWNHEAGKESRRKFDSMEESVQILKRNGYRLIKENLEDDYETEGEKLNLVFDAFVDDGLDDDAINDLLDNVDDLVPGWEMMSPREIYEELNNTLDA